MKICPVHFKADCPICDPNAAPVPPEMREVAPAPPPPVARVNDQAPPSPPPVPQEPEITDPAALKLYNAASRYAGYVKQVAILKEQVKQAEEALKAFEKKLEETQDLAYAALDVMREGTK